ncbi:exo-alpha-sialidase [uncultured Cyclobacterium sp.]|uniref:exo-alpha-sialidase n=1 Tax=uncultured Cyclobacterium sp. TaxID=453820 RepID=UPI0030EBB182|tara:strand:+ start:297744 stop:299882 length:2139 start_codon:yes stop_codon:yes gene_type:complete
MSKTTNQIPPLGMTGHLLLIGLTILFINLSSLLIAQGQNVPGTYTDIRSSSDNPRNSEGDFITLKDGNILFAYTRFMNSTSDHAPAQIMGRFSEDAGKTWSEKDQLIVEKEGDQNVMSVSFLRLQNGNIALFYARKNSLEDCIPMVRISSDEAQTWSEPKPVITDQTGYFVLNNDRVIQLKSGRILAPVSLHKTPNSDWRHRGELRCFYSDDMGDTWKRGQVLPAPVNVITQEPGVVEMKDGRIIMNIRTNQGTQYSSISLDEGITWSLAKKTIIPSPIAPASLARLNGTGDLILAWNNNGKSGPGYFKSKRTPLTVAVSRDEGQSWENIQNLEESIHASYAYTAIHEVGDHMLFSYYVKHDDKPGYDLRIRRMSKRDLYATRKTDPVLIVANKHSNTLSYLDPVKMEVLETINIGNNPHEITISPDQRFAYLSSYEAPGDKIFVVDLMKRQQVDTVHTGAYVRIHGAAFSPEGTHAYFTAGQTGYVVEVETGTNTVSRTIPTGGEISHMVYLAPDGKYLLTANISSENISVINRESGVLETLIPAGRGVEGMAFTPDGKFLWALNQTGGSITVIDWFSRTVVAEFECPGMPVRIKFSKDGSRAYVAGWEKNGTLTVIDVASKKEIKRIPVGNFAIGVEISPDGKYAFVGCEDAGKTSIGKDGEETLEGFKAKSDGGHVVDLHRLEVVKIIETGLGPDPMQMWWPPSKLVEN